MKKVLHSVFGLKRILSLLTLAFLQVVVFAQEKSTDINVNVNKGGGGWYTQPWVWIVGGAIFILLLVALLRGGGNKD